MNFIKENAALVAILMTLVGGVVGNAVAVAGKAGANEVNVIDNRVTANTTDIAGMKKQLDRIESKLDDLAARPHR